MIGNALPDKYIYIGLSSQIGGLTHTCIRGTHLNIYNRQNIEIWDVLLLVIRISIRDRDINTLATFAVCSPMKQAAQHKPSSSDRSALTLLSM